MERVLSVAQLNEYVRRSLAADPMLKGVRLRGEISNFKRHASGHLYFSVKDEEARIACVMFRSAAASVKFQPRDGMRVVLSGSASLYAATGQYQFYAEGMREEGVGALYEAFERLKQRLQAEGLFDPGLKKPLPLLPRGVGIITSPTGAVLHDIQTVAERRNPGVQLLLCPSAVQGEAAPGELCRALNRMDARADVDVIIIGRGGGSLEELWAFNEESVARAILACETPVVSAVGHETDFTIADFVADVRAATPSQAAELVVPRRSDLQEMLAGCRFRMDSAQAQRLSFLAHRLEAARLRLRSLRPEKRLTEQRARLDAAAALLSARAAGLLGQKRFALTRLAGKIEALSPQAVLDRGYALITSAGGGVVSSVRRVRVDEALEIRLRDGELAVQVTEVPHGEEKNGGL